MASVERGIRVLKNEPEALASRPDFASRTSGPARGRRAPTVPVVGSTIRAAPVRALSSTAGLADEPERLSGPDAARSADEGVDLVSLLLEDLAQVVEPHERISVAVDAGQVDVLSFLTRKRRGTIVVPAPALVPLADWD